MELHVVRAQGQLLKQLVRYAVTPAGNAEFYGATGILEFKPGEREVVVALVAKPDGVPEVRIFHRTTKHCTIHTTQVCFLAALNLLSVSGVSVSCSLFSPETSVLVFVIKEQEKKDRRKLFRC